MASVSAVRAQSPIHRCVSASGEPVFTDRACSDLRATPVTERPAAASAPNQGVAQLPPPILCARDNRQLRQGVIDAFANQDVNRLAGLMLWRGYSHRAAVTHIQSLRAAVRRPVLDLDDAYDPEYPTTASENDPYAPFDTNQVDPYSSASNNRPPPSQLVVHTAGTDGSGNPHEFRFDIIHRDGCLWLGHAGD